MAKKGVPSTKSFKNPLAQALGLVMHRLRNNIGLSSDDAAAKLGLGGSSYRMMEAGSATLHPGRALNVIKIFDQIEFDPLCRLLVAMQIMETGTENADDFRNATLLIGETDPQLQRIFEALMPVWGLVEEADPNTISDMIEQGPVPDLLLDFLTTNRYFGIEKEKRLDSQLNELIEETPSIYLDFILDTLRTLKKHRLHYFPEESRAWESDNKHTFSNLYAIIKNASGLLSKENFELFDYNYLWQPQFAQVQYIFLEEDINAPLALEAFKSNLKAALQEKHIKYQVELETFDEAMKKVSFRNGYSRLQDLMNLMKYREEDVPVDVLWIFTLKNGNKVGFMSNNNAQKVFYGTTLSYKETSAKLEVFKNIWGQL
jgi:hypothetical protein